MAQNRTCIVCGTKYHYCNNCPGNKSTETWRLLYHDENCRGIFKVCEGFVAKKITADEASEKLNNMDISNIESFSENIKNNVKLILSSVSVKDSENNPKNKKKGKVSPKNIVNEEDIVPTDEIVELSEILKSDSVED